MAAETMPTAVEPQTVRRDDIECLTTKDGIQAAASELRKSMNRQTWIIIGAIFLVDTLVVAAIKLIPPV